MKKVANFNKNTLNDLREALDKVLADHKDALGGVEMSVGNISYRGDSCTFKVKAVVEGGDTPEMSDYAMVAMMHGVTVKLGDKFIGGDGEVYEMAGAKRRSRKYPFIAKRNGKSFVVPADFIKH